MPVNKIGFDLPDLSAPATGDVLIGVDVSDTTDNADGSSKKLTLSTLLTWIASQLASLTQTLTNKTLTSPKINENVVLTATSTELNLLHGAASLPSSDGWIPYATVTPTTGTFDAPSFPIVFAGVDLTGVLQPGMRVKITQSTVKYFIITKVVFSTNTTVTLYGGTDYTLVASGTTAISAFSYSSAKAPFGFPLDPSKWTEKTSDATSYTQTSPTQNAVINLGSLSLVIPIGTWNVSYSVSADAEHPSANAGIVTCLSTANNSNSDADFLANVFGSLAANATIYKRKPLALTSKTTYYLTEFAVNSGQSKIIIGASGVKTIIEAVCAYL